MRLVGVSLLKVATRDIMKSRRGGVRFLYSSLSSSSSRWSSSSIGRELISRESCLVLTVCWAASSAVLLVSETDWW